jgi:hypothetical protein
MTCQMTMSLGVYVLGAAEAPERERVEAHLQLCPAAECHLIVRSRTGAVEVAGIWDAWQAGPVTIPASAGWLPADIASMQVATADKTLVTMNRQPGPPGRAERQMAPSLGTAPQAGPGSR